MIKTIEKIDPVTGEVLETNTFVEKIERVARKVRSAFLNEKGQEVLDPTPAYVTLGIVPEDDPVKRLQKIMDHSMMIELLKRQGIADRYKEVAIDDDDFADFPEDDGITPYEFEAIQMQHDTIVKPIQEPAPDVSKPSEELTPSE